MRDEVILITIAFLFSVWVIASCKKVWQRFIELGLLYYSDYVRACIFVPQILRILPGQTHTSYLRREPPSDVRTGPTYYLHSLVARRPVPLLSNALY